MCKSVIFVMMLIPLLAMTLLSCAATESETDTFDWPRWRGPAGDGISLETDWDPAALTGGPKILWKAKVGLGHSNVAITDGRLYAMGMTKDGTTVACLNADTGQEIWRFGFEEGPQQLQPTPVTDGKFVWALTSKGILFCLRARNGKLRWKRDLVAEYDVTKPYDAFAASPVIEGDLVVLTANNHGMALDKRTGKLVWISEKPPEKVIPFSTGPDYSTPVLYDYDGKRYTLISNYESLHSVEVATGEVLWTYPWEPSHDPYCTEPIVFDSKLFITRPGSKGSVLLDIGDDTPKVLWKNENLSSNIASPVLVEGYIYGCDGGPDQEGGFATLRCLDVGTGKLMWEYDLRAGKSPRLRNASLISAAGKLIILEDTGTLHITEATPSSYNEISSCDVLEGEQTLRQFWTPPVLCNGKIYCKNYIGDLICIDVSK
jgi:outer membrane protein assembly factor BamB